MLIQARSLAETPSRALGTQGARAASLASSTWVREAARSAAPVAIGTASHSDRCANRDFRLAVFVVCVQVWLVASSTLRLRAPGKTPGSVAHGDLVREAARGVPQVATLPWWSNGAPCSNRDFRRAVLIPGGQTCVILASDRAVGCLGRTPAA